MPKVIPFNDRILVKRRTIGAKVGNIYLPESTSERPTDLADVVAVPDRTLWDEKIVENAEKVLEALGEKAKEGDTEALTKAKELNEFLKIKSIQVGDGVMIGKYVGVDFFESGKTESLTLVREQDIIGLVVDDE